MSIQENQVKETDSTGAEVENWVTIARCWMSIEPLRGQEFFAAQQINATATHRVGLRYRPGLTAKHRLMFEGRIFHVGPPLNPEERNRELELMCTEAV
mgnify:CR=1 FL=1